MTKWVCTHKACHDGLASGWVARQFDPNFKIFFSSRQHEWKSYLKAVPGDSICFIDFSPKAEDMEKLVHNSIECLVLDHHDSDVNQIKNHDEKYGSNLFSFCKFDMSKAGCLIAWEHFFPNKPCPKLLEYISISDIWQWRNDADHAVIQYLRTLLDPDSKIHEFDEVMQMFDEDEFIHLGSVIHQRIKRESIYMAKRACVMNFDGIEVLGVNATLHHSEVGHELVKKSPNGLGVVYSYVPETDTVKLSVRGTNANKFAEKYGGGGHPEAAGFYMKIDQFDKYLKTSKKHVIMEV